MMTLREFYKEKTGLDDWGVMGEDVSSVWKRMGDVTADYIDYRVELKLRELDRNDRRDLQDGI